MPVIDQLATSLGRKDEVPNLELARQIAVNGDTNAIQELSELLQHKSKDIQSDSMKVLYEIAVLKPELMTGYLDRFIGLLTSKNNRLQWGAMTAISAITVVAPQQVYAVLPQILAAADKGSVITKDHAVQVLIRLSAVSRYREHAMMLLLEQLQQSLPNQLPMYAEQVLPLVRRADKQAFAGVLQDRLDDIEKESKRRRVEKVIGKIAGL
jgi:hypothetical protein